MDDDIGPIAKPVIGAPAVVIPRAGSTGGRGTLVADRLFAIVLAVPHAPWQYGDEVIVSVGEQGAAVAALARFREARPGEAVFTRQSPWRPFDRRSFDRYPLRLAIALAGAPGLSATVIDVSLGGCGIEVAAPAAHDEPLLLHWPGCPAPIAARVVRHRATEAGHYAWHLRFEPLDPAARAFLIALVAELAAAKPSAP